MSIETDAKILNEVQERFDVNITELPDEIELSSYSKYHTYKIQRKLTKKLVRSKLEINFLVCVKLVT